MRRKLPISLVLLATVALLGGFILRARAGSGGPSLPHLKYSHPLASIPLERQIEFLERRIEQRPGSAFDLAGLAALYVEQGRRSGNSAWWDKARDTAEKSLRILPAPNNGAKHALAQIALANHEFEAAIVLADEIIASGGVDALSIRVTAELALGRLDAAARDAETLVDRKPTLSHLTARALVYEAQGRDDEAARDLADGLSLEDLGELQAASFARTILGRTALRHGRIDEAGAWLLESLRLVPGTPLAEGLLAEVDKKRGRDVEAENRLQSALLSSGDPSWLVREGRFHQLRGETDAATRAWAQAEGLLRLQLQEGKTGHRADLARLLLWRNHAGDSAQALELMNAEIQVRGGAEIRNVLAGAQGANGRWKEARHTIREVLSTGARNAEFYLRAGEIEAALGSPARAAFYFEAALRTDPSSDEARKALDSMRPRG